MAWNPEEKGTYAWLSQQAKEHGGVDNFIDDIHNDGYNEGHDKGVVQGAVGATGAVAAILLIVAGVKKIIEKYIKKKKEIHQQAEISKEAIREICQEKTIEEEFDL